jgi:hypothetical protein
MKAATPHRGLILDEEGFSTAGMVIALLLTISLIFTSAQVYQINAASATIQNVADVAALAAQNEVAEFYIIAKACDAIVLSLSLTGIAAMGIGIVCLCTPFTAPLAEGFLEAGNKIIKARNSFAEHAASGLDRLQRFLPFIGAANAETVIMANSGGPMGARYVGIAVLLPFEGKRISVGLQEEDLALCEEVKTSREELEEQAAAVEEACAKAQAEKERAFLHDCGNAPGYCLYDRADKLAGLTAAKNPLYRSVDAWSFSVALKRAQAYYPERLTREVPTDGTVQGQAQSVLRKRFYAYACKEIAKGYVHEDGQGSFEAYFPLLPKNTDEMRNTPLYTECIYPITQGSGSGAVIHAWTGCPLAVSASGSGSLAQLDDGEYESCSQCGLSVSGFGKIAAATSSTETGFEYHYRIIAEAARAYQKALDDAAPSRGKVVTKAGDLLSQLKDAFSRAVSYRIEVAPPGSLGVVALVANIAPPSPQKHFLSGFVAPGSTLGAQAAISAATLVSDTSQVGGNIISSFLDNLGDRTGDLGLTLAGGILDLWAFLLCTYSNGENALEEGIRTTLDAIPFASASGLGSWAAATFSDLVHTVGLQPVKLEALRPVIVNSAHVLAVDDSDFSSGLLSVKKSYLSLAGTGSGTLFSAVVSALEAQALANVEQLETKGIVIASLEIGGEGGLCIPITIALPPALGEVANDFIARAASALAGLENTSTGLRRWE